MAIKWEGDNDGPDLMTMINCSYIACEFILVLVGPLVRYGSKWGQFVSERKIHKIILCIQPCSQSEDTRENAQGTWNRTQGKIK